MPTKSRHSARSCGASSATWRRRETELSRDGAAHGAALGLYQPGEHAPRAVLALVREQVHHRAPGVRFHRAMDALDRLSILLEDVGDHVAQLLGQLGILAQELARERPEIPGRVLGFRGD